MSTWKVEIPRRQQEFEFSFERRVEQHLAEKQQILSDLRKPPAHRHIQSYDEACIELAVAAKLAIRESDLSRAQVVDAVNEYFGWDPQGEGKHLSIHMLNHYLSKPVEYPMPAPMLYALHHVTGSLAPCRSFAEAEGGEVINKDERHQLTIGKLEKSIHEMQKLKRRLKG